MNLSITPQNLAKYKIRDMCVARKVQCIGFRTYNSRLKIKIGNLLYKDMNPFPPCLFTDTSNYFSYRASSILFQWGKLTLRKKEPETGDEDGQWGYIIVTHGSTSFQIQTHCAGIVPNFAIQSSLKSLVLVSLYSRRIVCFKAYSTKTSGSVIFVTNVCFGKMLTAYK